MGQRLDGQMDNGKDGPFLLTLLLNNQNNNQANNNNAPIPDTLQVLNSSRILEYPPNVGGYGNTNSEHAHEWGFSDFACPSRAFQVKGMTPGREIQSVSETEQQEVGLGEEQISFFHQNGYLAIEAALDPKLVHAMVENMANTVERFFDHQDPMRRDHFVHAGKTVVRPNGRLLASLFDG